MLLRSDVAGHQVHRCPARGRGIGYRLLGELAEGGLVARNRRIAAMAGRSRADLGIDAEELQSALFAAAFTSPAGTS